MVGTFPVVLAMDGGVFYCNCLHCLHSQPTGHVHE